MSKELTIYAWIFARGGSKGLPKKNIRMLQGKPLIAYSIETAKRSKHIKEVFVSTDCPEIAAVAEQYGAVVPFYRPAELSGDNANERLAWRHAIQWLRSHNEYAPMDIMVSLPATSPLRTVEEVDQGIELFRQGGADTVIAVSESARHPAFDMVYLNEENYATTILSKYEEWVPNRQSYKTAYNIAGAFYITAPNFVMECDSYLKGRVQAVVISPEHGIDIDTPADFEYADAVLRKMNELE